MKVESAADSLVEFILGKPIIPFGYKMVSEWEPGTLAAYKEKKRFDKWEEVNSQNTFKPFITYIAPINQQEVVAHPTHYRGEQDPYEAIKVIEAWHLGFNLGNLLKYVCRAGKKGSRLEDLKKALWYLQREITLEEKNEASKTQD